MDMLKQSTFTWWQLGLLKWSVFLIGIAVGAYFHIVFIKYVFVFASIGLILAFYVGSVWLRQR
jgi:hypothetical protein